MLTMDEELAAKIARSRVETSPAAFLRNGLASCFSDTPMLTNSGFEEEGSLVRVFHSIPVNGRGTTYVMDVRQIEIDAQALLDELSGPNGDAVLQAIFTSHGKGKPTISLDSAKVYVEFDLVCAQQSLGRNPG